MADEYIVTLKANTKPAEAEIENFGSKVSEIGGKIGGALAGVFAASKVLGFFQDATAAALESEKAVKQFNFALKAAGVFTEEVSKSFQSYAMNLQRISGVQDETILEGAAKLIQVAELSGSQLNRTIMAALSLAKDRSIDASEAFEMLTRAASGNTMAFGRMGIQFEKTATDAQKFETVLGFIETKMQKAVLDTDTYKGAITTLNNTWGDLLESVGQSTIKNPVIISIINAATEGLKWLQVGFSQLSSIIQGITVMVMAFFQAIAIGLESLLMGDFAMFKQGMDALGMTFNQQMTDITNGIITYESFASTINNSVVPALNNKRIALEQVKYTTEQLRQAEEQYHQQMLARMPAIKQFAHGFMESMRQMGGSLIQLGKIVGQTFISGFSNAFAAIGSALVKGEDAMSAFGKAILQMLGNIALQMGQFYIAAGIAAMFLNPAQGGGMIAAGIGLSILGGVLQALGGGGGAAAPASSGVGGGIGASQPISMMDSESFMNEMTDDRERQTPNTGVQVIVQGNILDRRETGLAIAEIINESFYTNGTIITANA